MAQAWLNAVEEVVTEVDVLRAAALDTRSTTASWPEASAVGEVPASLTAEYAGRTGFTFDDYSLEWRRLGVIEYVEAPPQPALDIADDDESDSGVPPGNAISDLPPDSVGPELAPVVREIGAIVVHTGNESLLADLLTRYGTTVSYVRDTTWTLVIDDRSGSSQ